MGVGGNSDRIEAHGLGSLVWVSRGLVVSLKLSLLTDVFIVDVDPLEEIPVGHVIDPVFDIRMDFVVAVLGKPVGQVVLKTFGHDVLQCLG